MIGFNFTWVTLYRLGFLFVEIKDDRYYFKRDNPTVCCKYDDGTYLVESEFIEALP
jgi:hypothetical protein